MHASVAAVKIGAFYLYMAMKTPSSFTRGQLEVSSNLKRYATYRGIIA